jgi:hypothetical protein
MAKIFSPPSEIIIPTLDWKDIPKYKAECEKYIQDLKDYFKRYAPDVEEIGEIVKFPVADGYALYMVATLKPLELVHIPTWDAYEFQYANRLTKKDILLQIKRDRDLQKLFPKK